MTNVARVERNQELAAPAQMEGATLLSVISRAAADPGTDVEKMERLMLMYERVEAKRAESSFNDAMSDAQARMRTIGADANNPQTRSKYASYGKLDKALRPIYTDNGFSLSFDTGKDAPEGCVRVLCYVSHKAGHSRTYHVDMPADGKGAKGGDVMTKTHAVGAGMSYGMRYLLKMIFNVAVGEEDVDGNDVGPIERITEAQEIQINEMLEATGSDKAKFLKWLKVDSVSAIPAKSFDSVMATLRAKESKK